MMFNIYGKMSLDLIAMAAVCKKPDDKKFGELFTPVAEANKKLNELDRDRDFPLNFVKTMRELVTMVNWMNIVRFLDARFIK